MPLAHRLRQTRLPVAVPPVSSVERIVDMVPDVLDRVEKFFDKKKEKETL